MPLLGDANYLKQFKRHVAEIGIHLNRHQHRDRRPTGSQSAELVLERANGTLHAPLEFIDVEVSGRHSFDLPGNPAIAWRGETAASAGDDSAFVGTLEHRSDRAGFGYRKH